MDISPLGIARNTLPQVPLVFKTAILALFGCSPNSSVQDVITEVIAVAARPVLSTPTALLKSQMQFKGLDFGVWGRLWIAQYTIPSPESEVNGVGRIFGPREALMRAIRELGDGSEVYAIPEIVGVETEWTGYRKGVSHIARPPKGSQNEQYNRMMEEVGPESPVILYFHGGAMW